MRSAVTGVLVVLLVGNRLSDALKSTQTVRIDDTLFLSDLEVVAVMRYPASCAC